MIEGSNPGPTFHLRCREGARVGVLKTISWRLERRAAGVFALGTVGAADTDAPGRSSHRHRRHAGGRQSGHRRPSVHPGRGLRPDILLAPTTRHAVVGPRTCSSTRVRHQPISRVPDPSCPARPGVVSGCPPSASPRRNDQLGPGVGSPGAMTETTAPSAGATWDSAGRMIDVRYRITLQTTIVAAPAGHYGQRVARAQDPVDPGPTIPVREDKGVGASLPTSRAGRRDRVRRSRWSPTGSRPADAVEWMTYRNPSRSKITRSPGWGSLGQFKLPSRSTS